MNDLHEYIEQLIEHDIERMHVSIVAVLFAVIEYRSSISDKDSLAVSEMIEEIIGSIAEFSTRVREKYE